MLRRHHVSETAQDTSLGSKLLQRGRWSRELGIHTRSANPDQSVPEALQETGAQSSHTGPAPTAAAKALALDSADPSRPSVEKRNH